MAAMDLVGLARELLPAATLQALGDAYSVAYGMVNAFLIRVAVPAEACLAYLLIEAALPLGRRNSWRSYWRGARFMVVAAAVSVVAFTLIDQVIDLAAFKPLVLLDLTPLTGSAILPVRIAGWLVAGLAVSMIGNVFYYWWHRAQHAVPVLWRFHKVHHSIGELSALNSYHHVTEDVLQYFLVLLPTALLIGVDSGYVPALVLAVLRTQTFYIHSSANINIGPLRYVIGDNRFHRLHHSTEPRHFGKNFGTTTPLWDVLFGTACFPRKGEWPNTGLADVAEPDRVADYLLMPFAAPTPAPLALRG
jgi:sterol desaturase/sphingolipid hydroxylase (fatty acid hydroxylase superfamily)